MVFNALKSLEQVKGIGPKLINSSNLARLTINNIVQQLIFQQKHKMPIEQELYIFI